MREDQGLLFWWAALAAAVLAFMWRPPSASPELLAALNSLRLDVGAIAAQLSEHGVLLREHGVLLSEHSVLLHEHSAQFREHGVLLSEHSVLLHEHSAQFREQGMQLTALAEIAVTPAVGARLESCSHASVVSLLVYLDADPAMVHEQCSAVPLPDAVASALGSPGASASEYFLTSAHCFMKNGTYVGTNATLSYRRIIYRCGRVATLMAPRVDGQPSVPGPDLDLAVLRCPGAVPVAPTRLSTAVYAAHTPAALVGFAQGEHLDFAMTAGLPGAPGADLITFALHTRISRLSSSFQTPEKSVGLSGCCGSAQGLNASEPLRAADVPAQWSAAFGFTDLTPWGGMSGGAVIDTHCGVFGITERRSLNAAGGKFIRLVPEVVARIVREITRR